jgi:phospholipid/cholesterol/gamma-HCH transport system permease protein
LLPSKPMPPLPASPATPAPSGSATVSGDASSGWVLQGPWTAAQLGQPEVWRKVQAAWGADDKASASWDMRAITRLDHIGAQLLWNRWGYAWPTQLQCSPVQRALLERVAQFSETAHAEGFTGVGSQSNTKLNTKPNTQPNTATQVPAPTAPSAATAAPAAWANRQVLAVGGAVLRGLDHARDMVRLIGQLLLDTLRLVRAPHEGPWRDFSGHLYRIGATAMPITALVGFLIGVVLAYLTSQQLRQFGADAFIVDILGLSLIRELGPVLAAILIAGRSGSAITAQIGVMRVTEEIDAMRVMGIAHGYRLVMPRAYALALVMPLISVWTTLAALAGGMLAADLVLGITPSFFLNNLPQAVKLSNLVLAVAKSAVFGLLIALIACHYGLRVKPNTESLGEGTTASVVASITVVILVDALFAVVFKDVGT